MTEKVVFHSSFDSTRYTGDDRRPDHPNLAQAQAEAITSLLLGRSLVVNNTYAFDSGSVVNLVDALLETRSQVRPGARGAGQRRLDTSNPIVVRWFGNPDSNFLRCCAEQLLRLEPPRRRFILSHWKAIDSDDRARQELAAALTSSNPEPPASLREHEQLVRSFQTLVRFVDYCRGQGRDRRSGGPEVSLLEYLEDFEQLEWAELERIIIAMNPRYRVDIAKVMQLRASISHVDIADKANRSWAHEAVNRAGGEDAQDLDSFLLEQRQLVDTLYNEVLADSAGSDIELLSSVPRTAGWADLEKVNAFALELIKYSKLKRREEPARNERVLSEVISARHAMSEVFMAAAAEPDLPAPPLKELLIPYWQLIAEDDLWLPWRDSCDQLEYALLRARRRQEAGLRADARLADKWEEHLDMLQQQLRHVRSEELALVTRVGLDGATYQTQTRALNDSDADPADSLAAGQYIDRYLRGFFR